MFKFFLNSNTNIIQTITKIKFYIASYFIFNSDPLWLDFIA